MLDFKQLISKHNQEKSRKCTLAQLIKESFHEMFNLPCINKTCCHLAKRVLDRLKWATHVNESRYTGIRVYKEYKVGI